MTLKIWPKMYVTGQALRKQLLLVSAASAAADAAGFVLSGIFTIAPLKASLFLLVISAMDFALAVPAQFSGLVWIAAGLVQLIATWAFQSDRHTPVLGAGFLIAGYLAGAWLDGWSSGVAAAVVVAESVIKDIVLGESRGGAILPWLVGVATWSMLPFLVGRYTAARRGYIARLEHQLMQRRIDDLAALDNALADERSAIARDLHDVISHHVSAIGIHAGAARIALTRVSVPSDSGRKIWTSLEAVEASSRSAMADLGRQLDLLHGRSADGRRQPGLANIDHVLSYVRSAGMQVNMVIDGDLPTMAESLDVALYRIVQELLTNALKHGTGRACLNVTCRPEAVVITEANPIPPSTTRRAAPSTRRGLTGIEQRAALFGGHVEHGPDIDGTRWQVTVTIPFGQT